MQFRNQLKTDVKFKNMAKRLRREPIYIAPQIKGWIDEIGRPTVIDERNANAHLDPFNVNDKITIYKRQVEDWFLNPATKLVKYKNSNNGFIVLMICVSYLEGVEQYRRGQSSRNRSAEFFAAALERIYPNLHTNIQYRSLYEDARCGLFHNGMVAGKIIINNGFATGLQFIGNADIKISPSKLLRDIKIDFGNFITELQNNQETQQRFDNMFHNM